MMQRDDRRPRFFVDDIEKNRLVDFTGVDPDVGQISFSNRFQEMITAFVYI
jgi:hypothetical protein